MSVRRIFLCGVLLWLALSQVTAFAHRLPPEVVAFFKVDGARLRVVVRVPTAILLDARFPMVQTTFLDLAAIDPTLRTVGAEVIRSLDVTDNGRPLAASAPTWIVSPLADRSFTTYDSAVARLKAPPLPVATPVYWNEAFADFQFDYALPGVETPVSVRLNGLRMGGDFFQTRATYIAADGDTRTVTIVGPPQRVLFEPATGQALSTVLRRGLERLVSERMLWLFILCLAIPARRGAGTSAIGMPFAAFTLTFVAGLAAIGLRTTAVSDPTWDAFQFVAGAAILFAAVQALVASGVIASTLVAGVAGAALGAILGARLFEVMPLAGSHGGITLTAFAVMAVVGAGLVLAVLVVLVRALDRINAAAWLITALLCALPAHEAAHQLADAAGRLGAVDVWTLPPMLAWLVTYWPALAVAAFAAVMSLLARSGRLTPVTVTSATRGSAAGPVGPVGDDWR